MKLSVIIPVFNEEKTVGELLGRVLAAKLPLRWEKEIIVIDDGSTDGTWDIIQSLKLKVFRNERNKGKGYSARRGIQEATGDVLIIQDADLEYDPDDYQKLLGPIIAGQAKVVYGTRLKELNLKLFGRQRTPLPLHFFANRLLSLITNLLYGSNLTDMETCYKMMTKEVYKSLDLVSNRFEIEPEITTKILKKGFKIREIPITTNPRSYKEGKKIKARDAFWAVLTLVKYRI